MSTVHHVVIEEDVDPDFSWLEQDIYDPSKPGYEPIYRTEEDAKAKRNPFDGEWYRDPNNHVALVMIAYDEEGNVLDSLGGIDVLFDSDDWKTGTFYHLSRLAGYPYLQELAKEMGLPE